MALDKTKTIRQRRVDVYLPSLEAREAWRKVAKGRGQKLSAMVYHIVEQALHSDGVDQDLLRRLTEEREGLLQEQAVLRSRVNDLERLVASKEKDLQLFRAMEWVEGNTLSPPVDQRILAILADAGGQPVSDSQIFQRLGLGKNDDVQREAALAQLRLFSDHGPVKETKKGWVWVDRD